MENYEISFDSDVHKTKISGSLAKNVTKLIKGFG